MSFKRQSVSFKAQVKIVLIFCSIMALIEVLNLFTGRSLNQFGLIPRDSSSLYAIASAPFLHGSLLHFFSNIIPLAIFSFLMLEHGRLRFYLVSVTCVLVSGILVWIFARDAVHVGASGLIYGYFGYLLLAGILSREIKLMLISLFIGFSYGGMVFGILPSFPHVSWESHLFGFIAGLGSAFFWGKERKPKRG